MGVRDDYVAAMKSAFVTLATRLTLTWAAQLSGGLTANFFVSNIIQAIAENLFQFLANQSELQLFFLYIDTRVDNQSKDFETAAFKNWKAQTNGTKEEKEIAELALWNKFIAFASLRA